MSFRTQQFCTLALVQDAHVNMPYQSWELRPRAAANHVQLTVTAAVVDLQIQIKVRLQGTKVRRYNWHSAGSLGWPFSVLKYTYRVGHRLITIILSHLNRFKNFFH